MSAILCFYDQYLNQISPAVQGSLLGLTLRTAGVGWADVAYSLHVATEVTTHVKRSAMGLATLGLVELSPSTFTFFCVRIQKKKKNL